ncbi:VOC family protein [Curtobacterium sp. RIT-PI-V]|uniref:VOC family protein n=1 Tax=Curtobacterium sp. RIT-PI-V TaxID=3035296 RepID=UPI0021DB4375|nr:VOC family protein [Curtobacterium sp. RIT-PI-V]
MTSEDASMPTLAATVLQSPEPIALARFYGALTGWTVYEDDPTWARIRPAEGPGLSVQYEPEYVAPTWPGTADAPGMQLHLDFQVEDLPAAVARAEELGATPAAFQPQDDVRVLLDPDGHPFCLFLPGA